MEQPEDTIDGSLDKWIEGKEFRPRTSLLLVRTRPDWLSIPMLILKGIAGKFGFIVELLKVEEEKDSLFADFPIGATM